MPASSQSQGSDSTCAHLYCWIRSWSCDACTFSLCATGHVHAPVGLQILRHDRLADRIYCLKQLHSKSCRLCTVDKLS